jgi:hypothetical protein
LIDPTLTPDPSPPKDGFWARLMPDTRTVLTLGYFALSWRILEMVAGEPKLLDNSSFMIIVTLIVGGGGLGAASQFFYGSSKGSADKDVVMSNIAASKTADVPTATITTGDMPSAILTTGAPQ